MDEKERRGYLGRFQLRPEESATARAAYAEMRKEGLSRKLGSISIETTECPRSGCSKPITSIERYHVTVKWDFTSSGWNLGALDNGTHFHLFCAAGHETKLWGNMLPKLLSDVMYPENA